MFLSLDLQVGEIDPGRPDPDGDRDLRRPQRRRRRHVHRRTGPARPIGDVLVAISTDQAFRIPSIRLAETQAGLGRPTYMYLFTWPTPVMDGRLKSCHALELPFMWNALDRPGLSQLTGDGPERQAIADTMHAAWIAFARTGDPGWPAYDATRRATQRFDVDCEILDDPMADERQLWTGVL